MKNLRGSFEKHMGRRGIDPPEPLDPRPRPQIKSGRFMNQHTTLALGYEIPGLAIDLTWPSNLKPVAQISFAKRYGWF
jgi:hypothetical protein